MTAIPTIRAESAQARTWDTIVVGAGPAGAFAARELAREGTRVLLLDRQTFPRFKVCGGCLNGRTLALLESVGLGELPESLGGVTLRRFELWAGRAPVAVSLPHGIAVSREALDAALVGEAIRAGAEFLCGERATLSAVAGNHRAVRLSPSKRKLEARVIVAADGLGGGFLSGYSSGRTGHRPRSNAGSRLGVGAALAAGPDTGDAYRPGVITMALGRDGYVGIAQVEGGRLSVAAALDRHALRQGQGPTPAVSHLLSEAGLPALELDRAEWQGTPALTRRAPELALERVFLVGDAAGYVEPFTGEGISWALETAKAVAPFALNAIRNWHPDLGRDWTLHYRRSIGRRQRWCRGIAWALRRPALVRTAAAAVHHLPQLATPLLAHLNATPATGAR